MKKILALVIVALFLSLGSVAQAVVADQAEPANQEQIMAVRTPEGETIATVTNALIDGSGNIAFLILSVGDGEGLKSVAVPLAAFSYDQENGSLILKLNKDELASAPEFNSSDLADPSFAERMYRYYGQMPPWDDGAADEGVLE